MDWTSLFESMDICLDSKNRDGEILYSNLMESYGIYSNLMERLSNTIHPWIDFWNLMDF